MIAQDLMKDISDRLSTSSTVNAVFGEPKTVGRKTIMPIACVGLMFGGGGGQGKQPGETEERAEVCNGAGGGGGGGAKPLAILEITDEETRLIPVIDYTRVITSSLVFAGAATWMITRLIARLNRNR